MTTHTRTHVYISFANPYLVCEQCGHTVPRWHDHNPCGCDRDGWQNVPCAHQAGVRSTCPTWGPVDGCRCTPTCELPPRENTMIDRAKARRALARKKQAGMAPEQARAAAARELGCDEAVLHTFDYWSLTTADCGAVNYPPDTTPDTTSYTTDTATSYTDTTSSSCDTGSY